MVIVVVMVAIIKSKNNNDNDGGFHLLSLFPHLSLFLALNIHFLKNWILSKSHKIAIILIPRK